MIITILISLWLAFIVWVGYKLWQCTNSVSYKFKNFDAVEIPYVTIDIQGNTWNMVVDSGCAVSLLSKAAFIGGELMYRNSNRQIKLTALTPEQMVANAITVDFNLGKKEFTEDFFIKDSPDFGNFYAMHGITLHGLLGASFFDKNNCKIDFKSHKLIVS